MAVHSGFFNSSNSDRKYNAEHFSRFFDGLICDGVYVNYPEKDDNGNYTDATARGFYVSPGSGIAVNVARGRCFFDGYWMYTDAVTVINLSSLVPSNSLSKKLVAIFIDVDTSLEGRELKFVAVAGNEVANDDQHTADPPTPANTQSHKQYPIALIAMNGNVSAINAANIYRFDTLYGDTDYRKAYFAKTTSVEALLEYSSRTKAEIDQRISKIEAPTFTEASTLANINSGENINTLWGKIKKAFTDLIFNPGAGNAKKVWIVGSDGKGSWKALKDSFDGDAIFTRSAPGIVPTAPSGSGTDKFLREDGSWFAPVGTNTNAQTVGNVEIAYNNGYPSYKYNGAWRRFKDPTGTASAGDVLSGKTFANAASDTLVEGSMYDYRGSNRKTVTPSGGSGNEQLSLASGCHDSVIVNRTNPYNAGVNAAQGVTWTETLQIITGGWSTYDYNNLNTLPLWLDLTNIVSIDFKMPDFSSATYWFCVCEKADGSKQSVNLTIKNVSTGKDTLAYILSVYPTTRKIYMCTETQAAVGRRLVMTITRQAKKIR